MNNSIKLLIILSLCLILSSCGKPADQSGTDPRNSTPESSSRLETPDNSSTVPETPKDSSPVSEEPNEADVKITEYKELLLNGNNLATNKEVFELFSFLLENGNNLTEEEVANVHSVGDDYDNVASTYMWYSQRGLDSLTLDILETKDLGSRSTGGEYDENRAGESFYLKVDVTNNGSSNIPLGQQEWVFGTTEPMYGFAALTPDELITFEEYNLRGECDEYVEHTDLIKRFIQLGIDGAFDSFTEVPDEKLIHYIVFTVPMGEDGTITQKELNAYAKELFGIDSLTPTEGQLYDPSTKTFAPYGYGPPYPNDYFKRVVEDGDGMHFDYATPLAALRYTIRDGKLVKVTDISKEAEKLDYGEITVVK